MHGNKSCIYRTKIEWENGCAIVTASWLNFRKNEINERFVTNLEPKFEIEHGRMKLENIR